MVKRLLKYLFSLCLILLVGLLQQHANAPQSIARCPQFDFSLVSSQGDTDGVFIITASRPDSKINHAITSAEEVIEEEVSLSKKYLIVSTYFSSLFDLKSAIYFSECKKHRVQLFRQRGNCSSRLSLNIIYEVFRL
jgi:hypothetical protein